MEVNKLIEIFKATIDPNQREQAESQLDQIHKIIGFCPSLLHLVMMNEVEMPVRQASVIYLKNLITKAWGDKDAEHNVPITFDIHEQDKSIIRNLIVDAVVCAPDLVRSQLCVILKQIFKFDFPEKCGVIVDKIGVCLQSPDHNGWMGSLLCLYQLVKIYEYKKLVDRGDLDKTMSMLLPVLHNRCVQLMPDNFEQSVLIQKQILKIYFSLTQYFLPLQIITKGVFSQWMEIVRVVVARPVPDTTLTVDEEDRPELPWWKCKKWALHILSRMFERYGSPGNVTKEYQEFSDWYMKTFSGGILEVLLKVLDDYSKGVYVSHRVLHDTLNYLNESVKHGFTWKFLKDHMLSIIQDVLFPLMCYTDSDDELWNNDPHEYIRMKFDIFEDYVSPVIAAQSLLHSVMKRPNMLQKTMTFASSVVTNAESNPRQKDGALHMIGSIADILLKKAIYKDQMENMLVTYVFPEFNSPHGYLRARACWVIHYLCDIQFKSEDNLSRALVLVQNALMNDCDLPVKVEAAICLQMLLTMQTKAAKYVEPQIQQITLELLKIIRETGNDDLTTVLQEVVCMFTTQLAPIGVEMTTHLVHTFHNMIAEGNESDEKAITAMGLLSLLETILTAMKDCPEIMSKLEAIILEPVIAIFKESIDELYDEAMSLISTLTAKSISPDMWKMFQLIYQVFQKNGFDYFPEMMPCLHNYITVDTQTFLSSSDYILAVFNMCKTVLTEECGEDPECHAAKLLEVILLQCKGQIDQCVPSFVELVLQRLQREVKTSELRTMCLQVVIAALYYNPALLLNTLSQLTLPNMQEPLLHLFIRQWLLDIDCFLGLHDRKMCVLGLCALISRTADRPVFMNEYAKNILPSLIVLFEGLKRAYAFRAQEDNDSEEDSDAEWGEDDVLATDESDIDEEGAQYFEQLQKEVESNAKSSPFTISTSIKTTKNTSDDDEFEPEETALESFTTPLDDDNCPVDEYVIFKEVLQGIQANDPGWYSALTMNLDPKQQVTLQEILTLADQRRAAAESARIEQQGGFTFQQQTVPNSFNFAAGEIGR